MRKRQNTNKTVKIAITPRIKTAQIDIQKHFEIDKLKSNQINIGIESFPVVGDVVEFNEPKICIDRDVSIISTSECNSLNKRVEEINKQLADLEKDIQTNFYDPNTPIGSFIQNPANTPVTASQISDNPYLIKNINQVPKPPISQNVLQPRKPPSIQFEIGISKNKRFSEKQDTAGSETKVDGSVQLKNEIMEYRQSLNNKVMEDRMERKIAELRKENFELPESARRIQKVLLSAERLIPSTRSITFRNATDSERQDIFTQTSFVALESPENHKPVEKNEENTENKLLESTKDTNFVEQIIQNTEEELSTVKTDLRQYLSVLKECKQKVNEKDVRKSNIRSSTARGLKSNKLSTKKPHETVLPARKPPKKFRRSFSVIPEDNREEINKELSEESPKQKKKLRAGTDPVKKSSQEEQETPPELQYKSYCDSFTCTSAVCKIRRSVETKIVQTEFTILPDLETAFKIYDTPEVPHGSEVDSPDNSKKIEVDMLSTANIIEIPNPIKPKQIHNEVEDSEKKNQLEVDLPDNSKKIEVDMLSTANIAEVPNPIKPKQTHNDMEDSEKKNQLVIQVLPALDIKRPLVTQKMPDVVIEPNEEVVTNRENIIRSDNIQYLKFIHEDDNKTKNIVDIKEPEIKVAELSPKEIICEETKPVGKTISEELNLNMDDVPSIQTLKKIQYHLEQKCALIRERLSEEKKLQPGEYISLRWRLNQPPRWLNPKTNDRIIKESRDSCDTCCSPSKTPSEESLIDQNKIENCEPCNFEPGNFEPSYFEPGSVRESNLELELANVHLSTVKRDSATQYPSGIITITPEEPVNEEIRKPKYISTLMATRKELECFKNECQGKISEKDVVAEFINSGMNKIAKNKDKNVKCPKKICFKEIEKEPQEEIIVKKVDKPLAAPKSKGLQVDCCTLEKETGICPQFGTKLIEESPICEKITEKLLAVQKPEKRISKSKDSQVYCCTLKKETGICPLRDKKPQFETIIQKESQEEIKRSEKPERRTSKSKSSQVYCSTIKKETEVCPLEINESKLIEKEESIVKRSDKPLTAQKPEKRTSKSKSSQVYCCTIKKKTGVCPLEMNEPKLIEKESQEEIREKSIVKKSDKPLTAQKLEKRVSKSEDSQEDNTISEDDTDSEEFEKISKSDARKISTEEYSSSESSDEEPARRNTECTTKVCRTENKDVMSEYLTSGMSKPRKKGKSTCPEHICEKTNHVPENRKLNVPKLEAKRIITDKCTEEICLKENKDVFDEYLTSETSKSGTKDKKDPNCPQQVCGKAEENVPKRSSAIKKFDENNFSNESMSEKEFVTKRNIPVSENKPSIRINVKDNSVQTDDCCDKRQNDAEYAIKKIDAEYITAKPDIKYLKDAEVQCDKIQLINYKTEYSSSGSSSPIKRTIRNKLKKYSTPLYASPVTTTSENYTSLSDGEVKLPCECSTSIGEIHLCHFANKIRNRTRQSKQRLILEETVYFRDRGSQIFVDKKNQTLSSGEIGSESSVTSSQ